MVAALAKLGLAYQGLIRSIMLAMHILMGYYFC